MMNDVMTKIWENPEHAMDKLDAIKRTPIQENIFDKVIKEGIGQA